MKFKVETLSLFILNSLYMHVHVRHVYAGAQGGQKRTPDPLVLEG